MIPMTIEVQLHLVRLSGTESVLVIESSITRLRRSESEIYNWLGHGQASAEAGEKKKAG